MQNRILPFYDIEVFVIEEKVGGYVYLRFFAFIYAKKCSLHTLKLLNKIHLKGVFTKREIGKENRDRGQGYRLEVRYDPRGGHNVSGWGRSWRINGDNGFAASLVFFPGLLKCFLGGLQDGRQLVILAQVFQLSTEPFVQD